MSAVEKWLNRDEYRYEKEKVYCYYLDMLKKESINLSVIAGKAITDCATCSMLQKITSLVPDDTETYELILEEKNAEELLDFLEASGRLKDGLNLIERSSGIWESRIYSFFSAHKNNFQTEAEDFFL